MVFVADGKWGYVEVKGFGTTTGEHQLTVYALAFVSGPLQRRLMSVFPFSSTIESDSVGAKGLTGESLYAPGVLHGDVIVAPYWSLSVGTLS